MEFKKLAKLKDVRNSLARHSSLRYKDDGIRVKTDIAVHHSLTKQGQSGSNAEGYAKYHVFNLFWPGVAYPFVIETDGTIKWCHDIGLRTYHVGNSNRFAIGICLSGDFRTEEPTKEQKESLAALVRALKVDMPNYKRTRGHNEFPDYAWKACPEIDYRSIIANNKEIAAVKATDLPDTYTIQEGDTFWSIANEIEGISVDEVIEYNKGVDPSKLKIGQVISLGKVKVSKPTPVKQSKPKTVTGTTATIQSTLNSRYRLKISVDNIYGDETKGALVRGLQTELNRQTSARLVVDGKFGPNTRKACINLKEGARGNITWILQAILHCRGFKLGKIDGVFGTRTRNAVRNFQSTKNLAKDGIAGPQTFQMLFK